MSSSMIIDYYTDVLCVWAWIAQRRTEELASAWNEKVDIRHRFVNVFGDTQTRIGEGWAQRGGFEGFQNHVIESAEPYDNAPVNADVWLKTRPKTSANSHLVLCAVADNDSRVASVELSAKIRHAFFVDARDIGELPVLYEIAAEAGQDADHIRSSIESGAASAALMKDYQQAASDNIAGSPSWVMNDGRQKLYGNVGFHVLNANVEGLFTRHTNDASWC